MPCSSYRFYYELLQKDYDLVKRADTETIIKDVPTGLTSPDLVSCFGLRLANEREILKTMLQAEREGFDAIAGACFSDAAIRAAGNLMSIPVVGPGETSMYLARILGRSFAIIDSGPASIPRTEHRIDELNMRSSVISYRPVRCLTLDSSTFLNCLGGDYDLVIENFKEVAQGCVEDGADVLISGCGLFSPMLSLSEISDIDGAPIIDPMQVSLKFAEMMVDFKLAGMPILSSRGLFSKPSKEDIQNGCKSLGLV
jgi:allantoin racemase